MQKFMFVDNFDLCAKLLSLHNFYSINITGNVINNNIAKSYN